MKGRRHIFTWHVKLWIHDDASTSQQELTLDEIPENIDSDMIQEYVQDLVGDWGIHVTVEETFE